MPRTSPHVRTLAPHHQVPTSTEPIEFNCVGCDYRNLATASKCETCKTSRYASLFCIRLYLVLQVSDSDDRERTMVLQTVPLVVTMCSSPLVPLALG
jgi:hypothetical protein